MVVLLTFIIVVILVVIIVFAYSDYEDTSLRKNINKNDDHKKTTQIANPLANSATTQNVPVAPKPTHSQVYSQPSPHPSNVPVIDSYTTDVIGAKQETKPVSQMEQHLKSEEVFRAPVLSSKNFSTESDKFWVPAGEKIIIADKTITGGLLYLGQGLRSVCDGITSIEPALIDPTLSVSFVAPDTLGTTMSYWPSYSTISPVARAAYIEWLAGGRNATDVYIGYVFLFFYGLERRMLVDPQKNKTPQEEIKIIINEVERLLSIYGKNRSFNGYASTFLEFVRFMFQRESFLLELPKVTKGNEFPLALKIGIGKYVSEGKPIPYNWALSWLKNHHSVWLRTPAQRCENEFDKLFAMRYKERFSDGLILTPSLKNSIHLEYRPASNSFDRKVIEGEIKNIPDVVNDTHTLHKLREVADHCADELDAYSRYINKEGERKSLSALALLPADFLKTQNYRKVLALQNYVDKLLKKTDLCICESKKILQLFSLDQEENLNKQQSLTVAQLLSKLGYGIEPDIRFQEEKIDVNGTIVLFRQNNNAPSTPTQSFKAAALLMRLASVVISADNEVSEIEKEHMEQHIETVLGLTDDERKRLKAYLHWLLVIRSDYSGLKKRLSELNVTQRQSIAEFLIEVANADGKIDAGEIKVIKKVYSLLQINTDSLYSDIHSIQTTVRDEPVTVFTSSIDKTGYAIPSPDKNNTDKSSAGKITLLMDIVEKKLRDTKKVQTLLSGIFQANDESIASTHIPASQAQKEIPVKLILGLDSVHSKLVKNVITQTHWARNNFELLCFEYGLLPDGAIENINGASLDHYGDTLIEDGDVLQTNQEIAKELLAA